ncbi:Protein kinase-like domain [Pseudocohnilembus persalinus]|uniref:Protein kinase-like domain n=1 Tax=Pseudocohnilembus persalinus TaxID=266149 RepID=A0A0V0QAK6_PSEPJ|nr:Protein kinase-like domain [Pseudocohnilembus persalinus]|eukprot:KRW99237.1 Protein kinase-like domain [Pseudocohnilembus persalinus]
MSDLESHLQEQRGREQQMKHKVIKTQESVNKTSHQDEINQIYSSNKNRQSVQIQNGIPNMQQRKSLQNPYEINSNRILQMFNNNNDEYSKIKSSRNIKEKNIIEQGSAEYFTKEVNLNNQKSNSINKDQVSYTDISNYHIIRKLQKENLLKKNLQSQKNEQIEKQQKYNQQLNQSNNQNQSTPNLEDDQQQSGQNNQLSFSKKLKERNSFAGIKNYMISEYNQETKQDKSQNKQQLDQSIQNEQSPQNLADQQENQIKSENQQQQQQIQKSQQQKLSQNQLLKNNNNKKKNSFDRLNIPIEKNFFFSKSNLNKDNIHYLKSPSHLKIQNQVQKYKNKVNYNLNEMITLKNKSGKGLNFKKVLHVPTLKLFYVQEIKMEDKEHINMTKLYLENYFQVFNQYFQQQYADNIKIQNNNNNHEKFSQFCNFSQKSNLLQLIQYYQNVPEGHTSILYEYIEGMNLQNLLEEVMFLNEGIIKQISVGILKGLREIYIKSGKTFQGLDFSNVFINLDSLDQNQEIFVTLGLKSLEKTKLSSFRLLIEKVKKYFAIKSRVKSPVVTRTNFSIETVKQTEREGVDIFEMGLLILQTIIGLDTKLFLSKKITDLEKEENQQTNLKLKNSGSGNKLFQFSELRSPKRDSQKNFRDNNQYQQNQGLNNNNNINNKACCCILHLIFEVAKEYMKDNSFEHTILDAENCFFIYKLFMKSNYSQEMVTFLCKCLRFKDLERPSIQSLLDDQFFNFLNQKDKYQVNLKELVRISNCQEEQTENQQQQIIERKICMVMSNCDQFFKQEQGQPHLKNMIQLLQSQINYEYNENLNYLLKNLKIINSVEKEQFVQIIKQAIQENNLNKIYEDQLLQQQNLQKSEEILESSPINDKQTKQNLQNQKSSNNNINTFSKIQNYLQAQNNNFIIGKKVHTEEANTTTQNDYSVNRNTSLSYKDKILKTEASNPSSSKNILKRNINYNDYNIGFLSSNDIQKNNNNNINNSNSSINYTNQSQNIQEQVQSKKQFSQQISESNISYQMNNQPQKKQKIPFIQNFASPQIGQQKLKNKQNLMHQNSSNFGKPKISNKKLNYEIFDNQNSQQNLGQQNNKIVK